MSAQTATLPVSLPKPMVVPIDTARNKKLAARLEHYKAEMPPFAPVYDRIFVYPLKDADQPTKTAGGIEIADMTTGQVGAQRGILIAAGAKAIEQLYSHGIGIGDIVVTARLAPWERKYLSREKRIPHTVLILRASEVVGSEDLLNAYEKGDLWLEMEPRDGRVSLCDRESARVRTDPEDNIEGI